MNCGICGGDNRVFPNRRLDDLPACRNCNRSIAEYQAMTDVTASDKAHAIIGKLVCLLIARHGFNAALDASVLILAAVHGTDPTPKNG